MTGRLVVVSNRLPVVVTREGGVWQARVAPGGLVTALTPVLRKRGGVWVGWPGAPEDAPVEEALAKATGAGGFDLHPVMLTEAERENFYLGFSNEIIWPLFHDLQTFCNFDPAYWIAYERVNRRFAESVERVRAPGDYVWVHDYHLMNVARDLRADGVEASLGFFLHIPFPPLDIFEKLPWREDILEALLAYDLLGFQTPRDARNFLQSAATLLAGVDVEVEGLGERARITHRGRDVSVGSFPVGVDQAAIQNEAAGPEVEERLRLIRERLPGRRFIVGVDRLDYTKGIPHKLRGFRRALERYPELRRDVTLLQVLSPSREDIPMYHELRREVERLVGEINGEFTESGWVPVHYVHRNVHRAEILAWYRSAGVALVTPLKDGMNLVAKEYCAANLSGEGVLILSEFAGTADELADGALLVNPYNVEEIAGAIHRALAMDAKERQARMTRLKSKVREADVFRWVDSFLAAGASRTGEGTKEKT